MTDHQPMPVAGYTTQSQSNVDLANEGKALEEQYLRWRLVSPTCRRPRCGPCAPSSSRNASSWQVSDGT